jgi:hypothetical protein
VSPFNTNCVAVSAVSTAPRAAVYEPCVIGVVVSKHHQPRRAFAAAGSSSCDIASRIDGR